MAVSMASGKNSPYHTYYYSKMVGAPKERQYPDAKTTTMATDAGFYFEACFYYALCKITKSKFSFNDLNGTQRRAWEIYNAGVAAKPSVQKQVNTLKTQIERAATNAANLWIEQTEKDLQKTIDSKTTVISVNNIAVSEDGGGNPLGDIEVVINGKKYTLELKWQSSSTRATRYFGPLSDATLFGGKFAAFMREKRNKDAYWNHETAEAYWSAEICFSALPTFLWESFGSNRDILTYLLAKGNVNEISQFDTKAIVHANYTGVNIIGLPELAQTLDQSSKPFFSVGSRAKEAVVFKDANGGEVATFGISKYLSQAMSKSTSPEKKPGAEDFSFQFYIAQKYVGMV